MQQRATGQIGTWDSCGKDSAFIHMVPTLPLSCTGTPSNAVLIARRYIQGRQELMWMGQTNKTFNPKTGVLTWKRSEI